MFSSLSSFIFGTSTPATTNSKTNQNPPSQEQQEPQQPEAAADEQKQQPGNQPPREGRRVRIDAADTISITQLTPSVTGDDNGVKRENPQRKYKTPLTAALRTPPTTLNSAKLLTPREAETVDENDFEEDWLIAEKQPEEDLFSDSDEEQVRKPKVYNSRYPCVKKNSKTPAGEPQRTLQSASQRQQQRQKQQQQQHINSHSTDSGARAKAQRNQQQRASNRPVRSVTRVEFYEREPDSQTQTEVTGWAPADEISFGFLLPTGDEPIRGNKSIEESWYITPPPCFTVGPMVIETSPFENLLIEHPSMSVYHSITQLSANEVTVSMGALKLQPEMTRSQPLLVLEPQSQSQSQPQPPRQQRRGQQVAAPAVQAGNGRSAQAVGERAEGPRISCHSATQLKQELLARGGQKIHDKNERQSLCRGALKRANKVRDFQSKGNRQRRADRQHCRIVSGANNNRKCCY